MKSFLADSDDEEEINTVKYSIQNTTVLQLKTFRNIQINLKKDHDPLLWWKENSNKYPAVVTLTKKNYVLLQYVYPVSGYILAKQEN